MSNFHCYVKDDIAILNFDDILLPDGNTDTIVLSLTIKDTLGVMLRTAQILVDALGKEEYTRRMREVFDELQIDITRGTGEKNVESVQEEKDRDQS